MIGILRGRVAEVTGGICLLDVGGVGYEVHVPLPALEELAQAQGEVRLYIHFHLREDLAQLFGFSTLDEKRVFEKIIGVAGIGPKTALSIMSLLPVERFHQAVEAEDYRLLSSVPGIGQKTAQRLVLELRGKLAGISSGTRLPATARQEGEIADAVDALVALGYAAPVAMQAVEAAMAEEAGHTAPALVRAALRRMGR